jgi:hypothetical protein
VFAGSLQPVKHLLTRFNRRLLSRRNRWILQRLKSGSEQMRIGDTARINFYKRGIAIAAASAAALAILPAAANAELIVPHAGSGSNSAGSHAPIVPHVAQAPPAPAAPPAPQAPPSPSPSEPGAADSPGSSTAQASGSATNPDGPTSAPQDPSTYYQFDGSYNRDPAPERGIISNWWDKGRDWVDLLLQGIIKAEGESGPISSNEGSAQPVTGGDGYQPGEDCGDMGTHFQSLNNGIELGTLTSEC